MKGLDSFGFSRGEKGGVFYLHGEDHFRKQEATRALVDLHLDPATRDFNMDLLRGSEVSIESLASILATPPMMAEWRVVVLQEVEALASSPKAREVIVETAKNPPPGLAFIISSSTQSKAKFYQELKRRARSVEFAEISPNDVPGWLVEWARSRHGVEMEEGAARALGAAVGTDLGVLAQEVGKLAGVVEEGEPITLDVVRRAGTRIPTQDRWEWMDLVGSRNFRKALKGLPVLLAQGESGVSLVIGLATHLLRLGAARAGGSRALEACLPPQQRFLSRRLIQQARGWTVDGLQNAILGLRRVDRTLKSTSLADELVVEEWLLGLMVEEGQGP